MYQTIERIKMKDLRIWLLPLIISLTPIASIASAGINDFNQKKYDSAFRKLLPDAEAGQPAAMFYLGRIFVEGLGSAPRDNSRGLFYIAKSAEKNYEPALRFLAQAAERSGNLKTALNHYERLRSNGDISVVERIAEINERLFSKERELTSSYCTSLDNSRTLNKTYNEIRYVNCILEGKIAGKTFADGYAQLKLLADKGNDVAVVQLAPYMLASRNDKNWDPVYIDGLFFKNIDKVKLLEQLRNSIAKADLTFETCRFTIAGSTAQQQNYRVSICRLAAIKGDVRAMQFAAERHLVGYDGFSQDLEKANFFIDAMDAGVARTELKLFALQLSKNVNEHFKFLASNTNIDIGKINEALDFQLGHIVSKANQNELTPPSEITPKAKLINEFGDCKLKNELNNFLDKFYLKDAGLESEYKAAIEKIKPDINCGDLAVERPRRGGAAARVSTAVPAVQANSQTGVQPSARPNSVQGTPEPAPLVNVTAPQNSKPEFPKLLELCDKKDAQSCVAAAELVIAKEALKEVADEGTRNKIAYDLVDKGVLLGSDEAKYKMYDLLNPIRFPSPSEFQKYRELLKDFERLKTDSAIIRLTHDFALSYDPIKSLLQAFGGGIREKCTQAILLNAKSTISAVEKVYLRAILTSVNCKVAGQ
jgi:TPR repeat protein